MSAEVKAFDADAPAAALAALQHAEQQAAAASLDAQAPLPAGPGDEPSGPHTHTQTLAVTIDSAPASAAASAANTPRPAAAAAALMADADADMAAGLADPQQSGQQAAETESGAEDKENNENAKPTHHPNQHSIGSTGSADSGKSGSSKGTGVWPAFSHSAAGAANGGVVASTPTGAKSSAQKPPSTLHAATFCSLKDDTWSSPSPKPFHAILRTPTPGKLPRGKPGQPGGGLAPGAHGCSGVHKPGSVHENCLCRYKDQNKFTFQPELGHAPLGANTSMASTTAGAGSTAQLRRGSHVQAMQRALSTPVRAGSVVAGVHDSPMRRAVLGDASARGNAGIAPGVANSMGTGVSHITTPDVLSPSLTALTASAASKRKSRSPLPGKRAKLAAEVMLSLDTPIRDLPPMTRAASAGSEPASAAASGDGKSKDAAVQTSPEKDLSALAKQLQLQLLRTAAEHKKLDEQLVAAETKLGAAVGDSALEGECEDLRLKMRAVRDIARDTIALMDRLGVPAGLPQATAFLDQYEEADREDDGDDADEDDDSGSGVDGDGNPLASPSKSRSKRKKQKLAAAAGIAAAQAAAQKFTFHVEAAAAADGLPLQHHKVDDPEMLNASGALLPPPSSVQLIKSPSNGATSNADFDIDLNGAHGAAGADHDALRAKEKELEALRAANALSSAELKAKADKLAAVERELTQTKFAQLKCAVSVAKYHFANGKRAMRWLAVSNDGTRVLWSKAQSMSGAASAALADVKEVLHGAHTLALKSNRHSTDAGLLCVSLVLPNRTLDVCFQSQQSLDLWLWGLRQLCKNAKA